MPADEDDQPDERTRRARKVIPRYARGEPQRVAVARNLAEGEMLQGILLEEGIPSILRRTGGFDVPDFLAAGPRDVMVPSSGVEMARGLLGVDEASPAQPEDDVRTRAFRILAAILIVLLIGALLGGGLYSLR